MKRFLKNNWQYLLFGFIIATLLYFLVAWKLKEEYLLLALFFLIIVFPMASLGAWVMWNVSEGVNVWVDEDVASKKKIKELEERVKELEENEKRQ